MNVHFTQTQCCCIRIKITIRKQMTITVTRRFTIQAIMKKYTLSHCSKYDILKTTRPGNTKDMGSDR